MDYQNGKLMFEASEIAPYLRPLRDTPYEAMVPLEGGATEASVEDFSLVARALHEVIVDIRQPEANREEATNQLMEIALRSLKLAPELAKRYHEAWVRSDLLSA